MNITPDDVLKAVKKLGPVVPNKIKQHLEQSDSMLINVYLSDLLRAEKIKFTHMQLGSSQFAYTKKQREKLAPLVHHLNEKDKRAALKLKREGVIRSSTADPLTRVCLQQIKDFAMPMKVREEIFYRWFLLPKGEARKRIRTILTPKKKAKKIVKKAVKKEVPKPEVEKKIEPKKPEVKEPPKPAKEKQQTLKQKPESEFAQTLHVYFAKKNIEVKDMNEVRKNSDIECTINLPTPVGEVMYFVKAKSKKTSNDGDLASALLSAKQHMLPCMYVTTERLRRKQRKTQNYKKSSWWKLGTAIHSILEGKKTTVEELAHKVLAIDAYNMLYQFLTTIRMRDGTPLKNSKGQVTSHMVGLFSRVTNFLEQQLKLVFVFDGEVPKLKAQEQAKRKEAKLQAEKKHMEAVAQEDVEGMRKYAGRTARLTKEMVQEAKDLLDTLGIPWIQAPAEGEAQAARLVQNEDADFVVSQDSDCLLYGAPKMIKNLSISGKRKKPGSSAYFTIYPETITLEHERKRLNLSQKQLIALGMLVGTDFNPGGIKGLGPKKGLKLVEEHGDDLETLFTEVKWEEHFDVDWHDVYDIIENMPTTNDYTIEWKKPSPEKAKTLLVDQFEFSEERVTNALNKLTTSQAQKGLGEFF